MVKEAFLRVTQLVGEDLEEVVEIASSNPAGVRATFGQIGRMPLRHYQDGPLRSGDVIIDLIEDDTAHEDPIKVKASTGAWLLGTFFDLPKSEWNGLVQTPEI